MRRRITTLAVVALVALAGCAGAGQTGGPGGAEGLGGVGGGDGAKAASSQQVGAAVGGAQDANAFRTNVREGYVPQPTDLTYEGLFHDYYFDTGQAEPCRQRFCPSYSTAVARDPLSNETERFLTVGLNSGLTRADVEAGKLNLVVVVDTSGSMGEQFDEYYYDGGEKKRVEQNQRKMAAAEDAIVSMLDNLNDSDRVSVVAYDDSARVVSEMRRVGERDMGALREDVRSLQAGGSTNLDAGMRTARDVADDYAGEDGYETRVVYVTDAMPNLGETGGESLHDRMRAHANESIHTTFVGVGVDFNSRLAQQVATVEGANYYAVHSPAQFDRRMDETFDYMVSPLAYNLTLRVEGEGYDVETVYGSPQADEATGELLHVETLFPSRTSGNRTEGGVVLVELERTGEGAAGEVTLTASYEDPGDRERHVSTRTVALGEREPPHYGSTGARKAVVLAEYGTLMRNWMAHERGADGDVAAGESVERRDLGQWEQQSVPLTVTAPYDERVQRFLEYFRRHKRALGADRMRRDLEILRRLVAEGATGGNGTTTATTTAPGTATAGPGDTATDTGAAALSAGPLQGGGAGTLLGLLNLSVTALLGAYGVLQKRRSRGE